MLSWFLQNCASKRTKHRGFICFNLFSDSPYIYNKVGAQKKMFKIITFMDLVQHVYSTAPSYSLCPNVTYICSLKMKQVPAANICWKGAKWNAKSTSARFTTRYLNLTFADSKQPIENWDILCLHVRNLVKKVNNFV